MQLEVGPIVGEVRVVGNVLWHLCLDVWPEPERLPEAADGAFASIDFVLVSLSTTKDDGLTAQIFDEAFVSKQAVPSFVFFIECLELKDARGESWRYQGADVAEVTRIVPLPRSSIAGQTALAKRKSAKVARRQPSSNCL